MPRFSLNEASEEAARFFRREAAIILPIAFATFGIGMLLIALMTPEPPANGQVEPGAWMLALIPVGLVAILGQLAISALVLRPGASVGEALRAAFARMPRALLIVLTIIAAAMIGTVAVTLVLGVIAAATGAGALSLTVLAVVLIVTLMIWFAARLLLVWPMMIDRDQGAVATLRAAWRLSKGSTARLLAALITYGLVYVVVTGAIQLGFGAFFLIVGKALGAEGAARFLVAVVVAVAASALQAMWAVFLTCLYRAAAPTSGS